ncbi:MAG: patatin-like phospholipase family protein [Myxococcota bacterium]
MGLTLIQRSTGQPRPRHPTVALVLAGGAVSGGAFKVGGLKALDEFLGERKVNEFDIYVGLSAGAFLATALAGGLTPDETIGVLDGSASRFSQLRPVDFYYPNLREMVLRPALWAAQVGSFLPGLLLDLVSVLPDLPRRMRSPLRQFAAEPTYTHLERLLMRLLEEVSPKRSLPSLGSLVPSGFFENSALERWLAKNIAGIGRPNHFAELYRETGRQLFITATNLDTAERVVFGPDHDHGLSISQAVQASSALPGFFRPARLNGVDYVDGGVRRTANIDVAIEHGADLVICYNPFRPFLNPVRDGKGGPRFLSGRGGIAVFSQVFRTLLHTRLALGLQAYMHDTRFRGDIVVIEARETDEEFFDVNPLAFWKRSAAIEHGYDSVYRTLLDHAGVLAPVLARYGLEFRVPERSLGRRAKESPAASPRRRDWKLVRGGRSG